jgi:hypothetical protein
MKREGMLNYGRNPEREKTFRRGWEFNIKIDTGYLAVDWVRVGSSS